MGSPRRLVSILVGLEIFNKRTNRSELKTHLSLTNALMSRPLPTPPLDRSKGDNIEEVIRVDGDVQRVGLQCFYTSPQALSTQP